MSVKINLRQKNSKAKQFPDRTTHKQDYSKTKNSKTGQFLRQTNSKAGQYDKENIQTEYQIKHTQTILD